VLAVLLLARWADTADKRTGECPLDVAPLLESIATLEEAGEVLSGTERGTRLSTASGVPRQSSTGRAGIFGHEQGGAASPPRDGALQVAQTQLLDAARDAGIMLTIFHSRGGTPPRGRGPDRVSGGSGAAWCGPRSAAADGTG